jgi:hypothetical protein
LSAEQQGQPEQDNPNSADGCPRIGQDASNKNVTTYQKEHSTSHQSNFFSRLKDRVNTHHVRALLQDPRAWIEIIALFTLGAYTYFAWRQSTAMNDTLAEVRKQTASADTSSKAATIAAKAAQDAITQSKEQFVKDQRPYLWLASGESKKPVLGSVPSGKFKGRGVILWDVDFNNYGRSPAHNLKIVLMVFGGENENDRPISHSEWARLKRRVDSSTQAHGVPLATSETIVSTATTDYSKTDITKEMFDSYLAMEKGVIVIGTIFYSDAGGIPYETGFCLARLRTGAVSRCDEENYIK